jgi:hypothetical protein
MRARHAYQTPMLVSIVRYVLWMHFGCFEWANFFLIEMFVGHSCRRRFEKVPGRAAQNVFDVPHPRRWTARIR